MTVHIDELINILATLCEDRNLRVSVSHALSGGLVAGISAVIGGLILGRPGLLIGGAIGGSAAAIASSDFKPAVLVLRDMSQEKKRKLAHHMVAAFRDFGITDVVSLSLILTNSSSFQELALKSLGNFLNSEMSMKLTN